MKSPSAGERSVLPETESVGVRGKLTVLSVREEPLIQFGEKLAEIAALPYVHSVLALPDLHLKKGMQIPSSLAVATRDVIVPELTSVAINDGIGVVATSLRAQEMSRERLMRFFAQVNSHASAHRFDMNRYSLSVGEFRRALLEGAPAVLDKYGLGEDVLGRMGPNGHAPSADREPIDLTDVVPFPLLRSRFSRAEMGLNFRGNHFLEVQVIDRVLDGEVATRWGLEEGQVVVMYHLGPGSFGGTLLHHYSRRCKVPPLRIPLFFSSKLLFHYVQRMGGGAASRKWALHFRRNGLSPLQEESEEGLLLRRAITVAMNFGFAYRLATLRAIKDGLHEALSPRIEAKLFWYVPHNTISEETLAGERVWMVRHNSCRLVPGKPTIVAGSSDVPSYVGIGGDGTDGRFHSYDHGAGSIIEAYRRGGRLTLGNGSIARFVMTRGRNAKMIKSEEVPGRSSEPIDLLMACLERNRIMRPVVRLRPIGNFRN